ncbi:MAG: DUF2911 domain-containing protein [Chitinophagaceae bacterium]|nr:DUF2911 domain-containing protein [Chitinophagaceae bacterium]
MKKYLVIAFALYLQPSFSQQLNIPQPSPLQTVKQNFGLSFIEISYSRPGVKNRKVFGDLVPYNQVWRTGANAATTITFGDEVTVNGVKIAPGKYGLLSIPGEKEWTIIISKQTDVTGPEAYKQDQDVVRVNVKPLSLSMPVETFTISIDDIKNNSCKIALIWDKVYVPFEVTTEVDSKVMKQIENVMLKDNKPYYSAANYYYENNKDLNQALEWVNKAVEMNPNSQPWVHTLKTKILAKLGRKEEARAAAQNAIRIAQSTKFPEFVKQNEEILKTLK